MAPSPQQNPKAHPCLGVAGGAVPVTPGGRKQMGRAGVASGPSLPMAAPLQASPQHTKGRGSKNKQTNPNPEQNAGAAPGCPKSAFVLDWGWGGGEMLYEQFLVMGWQSHETQWMVEIARRGVSERELFMTTEKWLAPRRQFPPVAGHIPAILALHSQLNMNPKSRLGNMPTASNFARVWAALPLS